jgi:hypothetical protein
LVKAGLKSTSFFLIRPQKNGMEMRRWDFAKGSPSYFIKARRKAGWPTGGAIAGIQALPTSPF